jgi:hypothetical protein
MYYEIAADQIALNVYGAYVLLIWAVGNIIAGSILRLRHKKNAELRHFHEFNALWNVVNLGIALVSLFWLNRLEPVDMELKQVIYTMFCFEKLVLFNAALDIAYVAVGFFLRERGEHRKDHRLLGYGRSLWVQGGFLFLFDLALFALNAYFNQKYAFFILF